MEEKEKAIESLCQLLKVEENHLGTIKVTQESSGGDNYLEIGYGMMNIVIHIFQTILEDFNAKKQTDKVKLMAKFYNPLVYIHNEIGLYLSDPETYNQRPLPQEEFEIITVDDKGIQGLEENEVNIFKLVLRIILAVAGIAEPILTKKIGENSYVRLYTIFINSVLDMLDENSERKVTE